MSLVVAAVFSDQNIFNNVLYRALTSGCDVLPCHKRSALDEFTTTSTHSRCKSTVCCVVLNLQAFCCLLMSVQG